MKNQIGNKTLKHLAKEYRSLGLSESEAELAARMEDAARDIEEPSRTHLHKPSGPANAPQSRQMSCT